MSKKNIHLIEIEDEMQAWLERYAECKNLLIMESLSRVITAGRAALENQELKLRKLKKDDNDLSPRLKIGVQASVECLSILRTVYLPDLNNQKQLAKEVKELIEKTVDREAVDKDNAHSC